MKFLIKFILVSLFIFLFGCEVAYVSTISMNKNQLSSLKIDHNVDENIIESVFNEYCAYKTFKAQSLDTPFSKGEMELILQCEKAWFYSLRLFNGNDGYEVQMFLMQPGPWRTSNDFFCSETDEMIAFFSGKIGIENFSVAKYKGCN